MSWELAPGKVIKAMAYNGQVLGPEIRIKEGERVRIVLRNALGEPTTVRWHGVDVPNAMDGVPGLTQKPVPPGGTFICEFEARPAGTRWYHTHFQEHRQMDLGLAAPLIIEPTGAGAVCVRPRVHTRPRRLGDGDRQACPLDGRGHRRGSGWPWGHDGRDARNDERRHARDDGGMMGGRGRGGRMGGADEPPTTR
ncbi:MAG: multicopper oxidase domain-containing protein [Candidatus Rokubacteria bacterium]|nr:multicopper oxidase domain-containing protein [Candidatus Rokubacteria bacterium]